MRKSSYLNPYARAAAFSTASPHVLQDSILGLCAAGDCMFIQETLKWYYPYLEDMRGQKQKTL